MGLGTSEEYRWTSGGQFDSLVTLLFAFTIGIVWSALAPVLVSLASWYTYNTIPVSIALAE